MATRYTGDQHEEQYHRGDSLSVSTMGANSMKISSHIKTESPGSTNS